MFTRLRIYSWLIGAALCLVLHPGIAAAEENSIAHESRHAAKYYCPMHPQVVSDKPGDCPICHMRLVLSDPSDRGESAHALEGRIPVAISDSAQKQLGIRTYQVEKMMLQKTVEAPGMIAHDAELYQLEVDFLREEALNFERERSKTLISQERGLTAREKIGIKFLELGLSQEWIQNLIKEGMPDKRLLYHHSEGGMWIYLKLRQNDASLIEEGDPVTIYIPGLQDEKFQSKIEYIDNKVDHETATVQARVLILNPPPRLKPHMIVSGTISVDLGNVLALPEDAPLFTGNRTLVFVDENGIFKPREVVLGAKAGGYYEVKEGLMSGEKVASSGNFFIDSESRLRSSIESTIHKGHAS